jgi:hypothetical protein
LSTLVWQRPLHTFVAGVQQVPPSTHVALPAHAVVPPAPQLTGWPQESIAVPHCFPAHGLPVGTQPHVFDVHVAPPSQPPQLTVRPQLSVSGPQRPSHQCGSLVQSQRLADASQKSPAGQLGEQPMACPQLSGPVPQ